MVAPAEGDQVAVAAAECPVEVRVAEDAVDRQVVGKAGAVEGEALVAQVLTPVSKLKGRAFCCQLRGKIYDIS